MCRFVWSVSQSSLPHGFLTFLFLYSHLRRERFNPSSLTDRPRLSFSICPLHFTVDLWWDSKEVVGLSHWAVISVCQLQDGWFCKVGDSMLTGLSLLCNHLGNSPASFLWQQVACYIVESTVYLGIYRYWIIFYIAFFFCGEYLEFIYDYAHKYYLVLEIKTHPTPFFLGLHTILSFLLPHISWNNWVCSVVPQKSSLYTTIHLPKERSIYMYIICAFKTGSG